MSNFVQNSYDFALVTCQLSNNKKVTANGLTTKTDILHKLRLSVGETIHVVYLFVIHKRIYLNKKRLAIITTPGHLPIQTSYHQSHNLLLLLAAHCSKKHYNKYLFHNLQQKRLP